MKKGELTQELLSEYFYYEYSNGLLLWRKAPSKKTKCMSRASYVNNYGYRIVYFKGARYKEHRLIWFLVTGRWPKGEIDHINHDIQDNSFFNLREVSPTENAKNLPIRADNRSKVTGVHFRKQYNRWCARITVAGKRYSKSYKTFQEAVEMRMYWEKLHGYHQNHGAVTERLI